MREFSFTNAWTMGVRFFSGAALRHAIILLGVGVLLPTGLQVLLLGRPILMMNAAGASPDAMPSADLVQLVTAAGYVLQTGSFFASWRLGLGRGESFVGALVYGLPAGVLVAAGFGLVLFLVAAVFGLITVPVALFATLVAFVALFGIAWTTFAALFAASICLLFLFALAFAASIGNISFAATMVGGSGFVWSLLVAASLVLLWLASRLSCTAVVMAERRSLNLFAAMRESWSLTWDDEWRITRYLGLLGLVMAVVIAGIVALAGAGLAARLAGTSPSGAATAVAILFSALSIPLAYLAVLVPAGIYLELRPAEADAAEVFA